MPLVALALVVSLATGAAPVSPARADPPWSEAKRGPERPTTDRWQRELDRRRTILRTRGGADPGAIVALLGLLLELEGEVPTADLRKLVDGVARDPRRHPLVRAHADYLGARLLEAEGDLRGAESRLRAHGQLVSWQIVGPFDNAGRAGEKADYPPEREPFSVDASYVGKLPAEPITWRTVDYSAIPRGGFVALDDLLRPSEEVTGYATCWVFAPSAMPAALHVGSAGAYKAWVDGKPVGEGAAYRSPDPLQDTHPIALAAGWNRILIKVGALDGMWGFYARVSARSGAPIPNLRQSADPPPPGGGGAGAPQGGAEAASLRGLLERAWERERGRPGRSTRAGLDLIELYKWTHPFDRDDTTAARVAEDVDERARSGASAWLLASVEREPGASRKALQAAIDRAKKEGKASHPLLARALLELAWRERSLGLDRRFRDLVDDANAIAPDDEVIELAEIDRLFEDGLPQAALAWLRDLVARTPRSRSLRLELVSRLRDQGYTREALVELDAIARDHGARGLLGQRIEALLDVGEPDRAAELAHRGAEAMPGLPAAHAEVARLEEARGNVDAARTALARAVTLAPQDADLHAGLGRLLARSGAREAAAASLRRSLELRPQQPRVRDLLASLEQRRDDLLSRWGADLREVGATPTPKAWKGKEAGILHHRVAVRVLPSGLTERLDHRIVRILDDRGVRSQAVQALSFDPAESNVEVRRARVRRKDGSIEELGDVRIFGLAQAGFRMYYDQRQIEVRFPGLRPGDTLEVAFVRRDVAARNMFDEYFGDMVPLSGIEPRRFVEYVLEAPGDKPIHFNRKVARKKAGDKIVYRYSLRDVPGVKPEPGMPGWSDVAEYLHASTYRTWDDVGTWYWGLVREQLVVDDSIRGAVADVLGRLPTGADARVKTEALYEHVVRNTRYVGLEFGIHGYKPYRTTDVYSRRFGDCKDKASLLKVMLREAGIDSHLVLVRTRDQGNVPDLPASLAVFNHAIVYVPSLDLWLDGTAEWAGPGELPALDQGATVLVVRDGKGAQLRTIPISAATANRRDVTQDVKLEPGGAARVHQHLTVTGAQASGVRFEFQSPEERREKLSRAMGGMFAGLEVESVSAPAIGDIRRPAELDADLRVPAWANRAGERLRFRVLGRDTSLAQSLAPQAERKHDLVLDVPSIERHNVKYDLPRGLRMVQLPASKTIDTPLGRFSLTVTRSGDGATVESVLELRRARIAPADYSAFREFLRQVDATLAQQFELEVDR